MKELEAWNLKQHHIDALKDTYEKKWDKTVKSNNSDIEIPAGAEDRYWAVLWVPGFSSQTGDPVNKPYIQSFSRNEWIRIDKSHSGFAGVRVHIIHNPENKSKTENKIEAKGASGNYDDLTRHQLMDLMDEKGIKYQKNENKDELINKLNA